METIVECVIWDLEHVRRISTGHVPLFHLTDIDTCFPAAMFDGS